MMAEMAIHRFFYEHSCLVQKLIYYPGLSYDDSREIKRCNKCENNGDMYL